MKLYASLLITAALALTAATTSFARAAKTMVGQKLPELKVNYIDPKPETAGKPMIVEFWATWCPPCRQSIPHLNEIYKKYKDQGLVVIGLTDEDRQTVSKFRKQVPIDYTAAIDRDGKLGKEFGVDGIPHAVLVNKSGEIVWEGHPMSLTDADIEKIVK